MKCHNLHLHFHSMDFSRVPSWWPWSKSRWGRHEASILPRIVPLNWLIKKQLDDSNISPSNQLKRECLWILATRVMFDVKRAYGIHPMFLDGFLAIKWVNFIPLDSRYLVKIMETLLSVKLQRIWPFIGQGHNSGWDFWMDSLAERPSPGKWRYQHPWWWVICCRAVITTSQKPSTWVTKRSIIRNLTA